MSRRQHQSQSKRSLKTQRRTVKNQRQAIRKRKRPNKQIANQALNSFFESETDIFSDYQFHGNIKWSATVVAKMALLLCWSEKVNITDGFTETLRRCQQLSLKTVHTTYQGFMGALTNYGHVFVPLMILQLQRQMQKTGGRFWKIGGFVPIAFDGSRNSAARSVSNEQQFCSAATKRKAVESPSTVNDPKPQAWITLMWHMGLRLPWVWRLGPSDSSERQHVQEMLEHENFPENTIFCGDAGFVGYEFWKAIMDRGCHFLIRVGSNVKLIQTDDEGYVLSWPKDKQDQPPLKLRLVQVVIGNTEVYLLTSVLDVKQLDDSMVVKLYKKRWGIEIEFRGLKQTLHGQKLRCRNADRVYTELNWSLIGMAVAELLAVRQQTESCDSKSDYNPKDCSLAKTMRAIHECLDRLHESVPPSNNLFSQLDSAITDGYQRKASKKARFRPKVSEKKKKKIKPPQLRPIEQDELEKLKQFQVDIAA